METTERHPLAEAICAVDFGLVFTKVAIALDGQYGHVSQLVAPGITRSSCGHFHLMIPTTTRCDSEGTTLKLPEVQIDHFHQDRLFFLKLLLEDEGSQPENSDWIDEVAQLRGGHYSRSRPDALPRFFKTLSGYLLSQSTQRPTDPLNGSQALVKRIKSLIFTVPISWSEKSKHMFWKHATQGFAAKPMVDLHFISEPEAALYMFWYGCKFGGAQYPLDDDQTYPPMQSDQLVLIYDVGGLAARIMVYQVTPISTLKFREFYQGADGLCGSLYLDKAFMAFMNKKLQRFLSGPGCPPVHVLRMYMADICMNFTQFIKKDFRDDPNTEYSVRLPEGVLDDAAENIQDEILTLYRKDMLSIFNPVMRACEDHIRASLKDMEEMPYVKEHNHRISSVFLVGSLANSPMLRRRIAKIPALSSARMICPRDASTTVVDGAVQSCTSPTVLETISSRLTLGSTFWIPWKDNYPSENRIWEKYECRYYARNCMHWFVTRGQEQVRRVEVTLNFHKNVELDKELVFEDSLWTTDTNDILPRFKNPECRLFATIRTSIPSSAKSPLKKTFRPKEYGGDYHRVPYSIVLRLDTIITAKLVLHGRFGTQPSRVPPLTSHFDVRKALKYHRLSNLSFPENLGSQIENCSIGLSNVMGDGMEAIAL